MFSAGNYRRTSVRVDGYWGYVFKNNLAPVIVGEFGSKLETVSDQQWMDRLTDTWTAILTQRQQRSRRRQEGHQLDNVVLQPNSGDTGGIVGDDWQTCEHDKLAYISQHGSLARQQQFSTDSELHCDYVHHRDQAVCVAWTTQNAHRPRRYRLHRRRGTLTFAAGETSKVITITLLQTALKRRPGAFHLLLGSRAMPRSLTAPPSPHHTEHSVPYLAGGSLFSQRPDQHYHHDELADPDGDGVATFWNTPPLGIPCPTTHHPPRCMVGRHAGVHYHENKAARM